MPTLGRLEMLLQLHAYEVVQSIQSKHVHVIFVCMLRNHQNEYHFWTTFKC